MIAVTHPDANTLALFGLGRLAAAERAAIEAHIAECPGCCSALEGVREDSLVELARAAMTTNPLASHETLPPDVPPALVDHPRYKVLGRIGAGGMGAVYKAEHRIMGRTVALKVVAPGLIADPAALERFRREVRLASRLAHPNIVTAFDADEAGGQHFLVMEFVEGVSLHRLVAKKGPLPVATACQLVRQVALGLQHAFEKGMVHRDIKPHNLMVTRKGQVKILDFGLARIAGQADGPASTHVGGVTAPNVVLGTPDFLAPEQARNAAVADIRSDLYALGCSLYYLLTGRPPFEGDTAISKLIAHVQDEAAPVSASRSDVPAGLVEVLASLMAKDPALRPKTPTEAAALLAPFTKATGSEQNVPEAIVEGALSLDPPDAGESPQTATLVNRTVSSRRKRRPPKRGSSRRTWLLASGGLVLAVIVGGFLFADKLFRRPVGANGPSDPSAKGKVPTTTAGGKSAFRVVMVLPSQFFWNADYEPVRKMLEAQGCQISVASLTPGKALPDPEGGGVPVPVDLPLSRVKAGDWDALVVCGGKGVTEFLKHREGGSVIGPVLQDFFLGQQT